MQTHFTYKNKLISMRYWELFRDLDSLDSGAYESKSAQGFSRAFRLDVSQRFPPIPCTSE